MLYTALNYTVTHCIWPNRKGYTAKATESTSPFCRAKIRGLFLHFQKVLRGQYCRVLEPYSLNPDPDPAKNLNPDTEDPPESGSTIFIEFKP